MSAEKFPLELRIAAKFACIVDSRRRRRAGRVRIPTWDPDIPDNNFGYYLAGVMCLMGLHTVKCYNLFCPYKYRCRRAPMIEGKRSRWCKKKFPDSPCPHVIVAKGGDKYNCPSWWSGVIDDIRWYASFLK